MSLFPKKVECSFKIKKLNEAAFIDQIYSKKSNSQTL